MSPPIPAERASAARTARGGLGGRDRRAAAQDGGQPFVRSASRRYSADAEDTVGDWLTG